MLLTLFRGAGEQDEQLSYLRPSYYVLALLPRYLIG